MPRATNAFEPIGGASQLRGDRRRACAGTPLSRSKSKISSCVALLLPLLALACDERDLIQQTGQVLAQSGQATVTALPQVANPAPDFSAKGGFRTRGDGVVEFRLAAKHCPMGLHRVVLHDGNSCGDDAAAAGGPWLDDPASAEIGQLECDESGEALLVVPGGPWSLEAQGVDDPGGHPVVVYGLDPQLPIACGVVDGNDDHELEVVASPRSLHPAAQLSASMSLDAREDYAVEVSVVLEGCPAGFHGMQIHTGSECGEDGRDAGALWDPFARSGDQPLEAAVGPDAGVICGADARAELTFSTELWTLVAGEVDNPIGHTLIVYGAEPGQRVACGQILAGPELASPQR